MRKNNKLAFGFLLAVFLVLAFSSLSTVVRADITSGQYTALLDTVTNPTDSFECVNITLGGIYSTGTQSSSSVKVAVQNDLDETKYIGFENTEKIAQTNVTFVSETTETADSEVLLTTTSEPTESFGGTLTVVLGGIYQTGTSGVNKAKLTIKNNGTTETKFVEENTSAFISGVKIYVKDAVVTTPGTNEGKAKIILYDVTLYNAKITLERDGDVETKYIREKESGVIAGARVEYLGRYFSVPTGTPKIKLHVFNPVTDVKVIDVSSTEELAGLDITVYGIYETGTGDEKKVKIIASDGSSTEIKFIENDTTNTMLGALIEVQDIYEASPEYEAKLSVSTDYATETKFIENGSSDTITGVDIQVLSIDKDSEGTNEGSAEVLLDIPEDVCELTCSDTDGGKDYYVKGTVIDANDQKGTDFCWNYDFQNYGSCEGNESGCVLVEHYCTKNESIGKEKYDCPYGCYDGICVKENEKEPPVAKIYASSISGEAPLEVFFNANRSYDSDGNIVQYYWNFDDNGAYSSNMVVTYIFDNPGKYEELLAVQDNDGLNGTAYQTISVSTSTNETENETINESIQPSPGLNSYTRHFVKNNKIEGKVVMGKEAAAPDVEGAADLTQYLGAVSGSTQSAGVLDAELSSSEKQNNLILVGGPAKIP